MLGNFFVTKIYLPVLLFLLSIFPWSQGLLSSYQKYLYPGEQKVCSIIAEAIKNDDVDPIYELTSDKFKEKYSDLKERLQEMIDIIDEDIISYKCLRSGSSSRPGFANQHIDLVLNTATKRYVIYMNYIIVNTERPKEVGVSYFALVHEYRNDAGIMLYSIYSQLALKDDVLVIRDALINNDSDAIYEIIDNPLKEKYPDLREQINCMVNMINGNYKNCIYESYNRHIFQSSYVQHIKTIIYETDIQTYRITTFYVPTHCSGNNKGLNGIILERINDDGTCEELFSILDEENWLPDYPLVGS